MADADTLRALTRSGAVRLIRRLPPENHPEVNTPAAPAEALPVQSSDARPEAVPETKTGTTPESTTPSTLESTEIKTESSQAKTSVAYAPVQPSVQVPTPVSGQRPTRPYRKARLVDLARMILPAKREEPAPTIVPPSFPVEISAGSVLRAESPKLVLDGESSASEVPSPTETPDIPAGNTAESVAESAPVAVQGKTPATIETTPAHAPGTAEAEKKPELVTPEKSFTPEIKTAAASMPPEAAQPKSPALPPAPSEKREFFLTNGERILGRVISETHDSVYLEHATLGVLTLPRTQIAKRLVELILINGDRIVGDIVAETPECLFVRHASLGMLTVPQAQRSTRVVEAILKDGDRIIGEVLAETDTYTVIRSSTLGTVTVQHRQLAMLNRKVEQVALKALPPATPALENKSSA
jgi:RNase P/RNase MRP subunit p29